MGPMPDFIGDTLARVSAKNLCPWVAMAMSEAVLVRRGRGDL